MMISDLINQVYQSLFNHGQEVHHKKTHNNTQHNEYYNINIGYLNIKRFPRLVSRSKKGPSNCPNISKTTVCRNDPIIIGTGS